MSTRQTGSTLQPRWWQWPNILSIDAAAIALVWLWAFTQNSVDPLHWAGYSVLATSTWLVYCADRLLDVAQRNSHQLLSHRHLWTKAYARQLGLLWTLVLIGNISLACTQLNSIQLRHGWQLLCAVLLYTLLNQKLSQRYFPKEICVALLYTGGLMVFLEWPQAYSSGLSFTLLCLINCVQIGLKEKSIDHALKVYSIARHCKRSTLWLCFGLAAASLLFVTHPLRGCIAASLLMLALLQLFSRRLPIETFRVLADAALFVGPLWLLMLQHC
jgi:hypothetical protein